MVRDEQYHSDEIFIPQDVLGDLCQQLPTPFYLYDETGLRRTIGQIQQAFSWNSGYREFFPVRINTNKQLLTILQQAGIGAVCSCSMGLDLAVACGFSGQQLMYGCIFPDAAALEVLAQHEGTLLLDNLEAGRFCMQNGVLPRSVLLHYNPGGKFLVGMQAVARPERSKLGMDKQDLLVLAEELHRWGVKEIGLQADLAKQVTHADYFGAVLALLHELGGEVEAKTGVKIAKLNLGGDIGLGFQPDTDHADILELGKRAKIMAEKLGIDPQIPIQTNIGRFVTGPHAVMVTKVLCTKTTSRNYAFVDAPTTRFMWSRRGAYHHISVVGKTQLSGRRYYDVVGLIPDPTDRFAERRMLPQMQAGDYCVFHDAGAEYGASVWCAEYLYTTDGTVRQIRDAGFVPTPSI